MRADEEYVKNAMTAYLIKNNIECHILQGEDPPDYYVKINKKKILFEVTQGIDGYYEDGVFVSRLCSDAPILNIGKWLKLQINDDIPCDRMILVYVEGPIVRNTSFKWQLKYTLLDFISSNSKVVENCTEWTKMQVNNMRIQVIMKKRDKSDTRSIILFTQPRFNKLRANIEKNVQDILVDILQKKEVAMSKVNFNGEKWLAILNQYPLANDQVYYRTLTKMSINHSFSKIFYIGENQTVKEVFTR